MKKILLIMMVLMPFLSKAMTFKWKIGADPSTLTVDGGTIGEVQKLVLFDVSDGFDRNDFWHNEILWQAEGRYTKQGYNPENLYTLKEGGEPHQTHATINKKRKLLFAVVGSDGNYFGSNVIETPTRPKDDTVTWVPEWALQADNTKEPITNYEGFNPGPSSRLTVGGWEIYGQTVPEPSTLAAILLGATFMLARRKRQD